jgi:ribonuclease HI
LEENMKKINERTNEAKPLVARTTNGLISKSLANVSVFGASTKTASQNSINKHQSDYKTVRIVCAGRHTHLPDNHTAWAFVALDENYEEFHRDHTHAGDIVGLTQEVVDYIAVIDALRKAPWPTPPGAEVDVLTDSKYVVERNPHDCKCQFSLPGSDTALPMDPSDCDYGKWVDSLRRDLKELMDELGINTIHWIPTEINEAADLAENALKEGLDLPDGSVMDCGCTKFSSFTVELTDEA